MGPAQMFPNIICLQYILQIQSIFVEFFEIYSMNICQGIRLSDLSLEKSDSQTLNIHIAKYFSRPKD